MGLPGGGQWGAAGFQLPLVGEADLEPEGAQSGGGKAAGQDGKEQGGS